MNRDCFSCLLLTTAICLLAALSGGQAAICAEEAAVPCAVVIADDEDTRGDWIGTYGAYAYILCGMRAPHSLCGGSGWLVPYRVFTGDPQEVARVWHSTAPPEQDRSVLWEPDALVRTPAAFDDHGEARPLGKGPDLHLTLPIRDGPFLLSLYFFEVDWIQYRAYRIRVLREGEALVPLVETTVDQFLQGKYKRFAVVGPVNLHIVIERGQSPNAQVSGIFLDKLAFPDMTLLELADAQALEGRNETTLGIVTGAGQALAAAEGALGRALEEPGNLAARQEYVKQERLFFQAMADCERGAPAAYYRNFNTIWTVAHERTCRAAEVVPEGPYALQLLLLSYYAAQAHCDFEGARQATRKVAGLLLQQSLRSTEPFPREASLLRDYAITLMADGHRAEATALLEAYLAFCLQRLGPQEAREQLVTMGRRALRAGTPLPVARGLADWGTRHGKLQRDELLLLGSLYYVAGKNNEALAVFKTVEPELQRGEQHRWLLVAMLTAELRVGRLNEAKALMNQLQVAYPGAAELDEARFRLGVFHFDRGELDRARVCFEDLLAASRSPTYRRMCTEYLDRIAHLEDIRRHEEATK